MTVYRPIPFTPRTHGDESDGETGVTVLAGWPSYYPDLNPQENVWAWAENRSRYLEVDADSFGHFRQKLMRAVCD